MSIEVIIFGIVMLHLLLGLGWVFYKIFAQKNDKQ